MAAGFTRLEDFDRPDVKIAARLGSTAEMAARKYMPQVKLQLFNDEFQVIQELRSGRVHALVASAPLPAFLALENPEVLFLPLQETLVPFQVRHGYRKLATERLEIRLRKGGAGARRDGDLRLARLPPVNPIRIRLDARSLPYLIERTGHGALMITN